jgi:hypothetical protein
MAPKKAPEKSKKNEQKKKKSLISDATFGLKNKNKSKKVQQLVDQVSRTILNSGDRKTRQAEEARKQHRVESKMKKKAQEEEQNALFGAALMAVKSKGGPNFKEGKQEAKGRDAGDEDVKKGTSRAMKMMFQMDAQEMEEKLKEDVSTVFSIGMILTDLAVSVSCISQLASLYVCIYVSPTMYRQLRTRLRRKDN